VLVASAASRATDRVFEPLAKRSRTSNQASADSNDWPDSRKIFAHVEVIDDDIEPTKHVAEFQTVATLDSLECADASSSSKHALQPVAVVTPPSCKVADFCARLQPKVPLRAPPDNGTIPRCDVGDEQTCRQALKDVGAVILRNVASLAEVAHAESLFCDWLESLPLGIKRNDPSTIRTSVWRRLGYSNTGVITNYSIGQSSFMWYLRMLPRVRQSFATVGAWLGKCMPMENVLSLASSLTS